MQAPAGHCAGSCVQSMSPCEPQQPKGRFAAVSRIRAHTWPFEKLSGLAETTAQLWNPQHKEHIAKLDHSSCTHCGSSHAAPMMVNRIKKQPRGL